jgi:ribonuclease E
LHFDESLDALISLITFKDKTFMSTKILINAVDPAECRIAKVKDGKLEDFHTETAGREVTQGNIYKGTITRVEPSLQAVFVEYGAERNGFLQQHEIHSDYYQDPSSKDQSITNLVKRGQELLVQVTKDPVMKKGAMLTTLLSLPGRRMVLMPGSDSRGISRKLESDEERNRLKDILKQIKVPEGFGIIIRTAGQGCSKTSISKDLSYLMRLWKNIKGDVMKVKAPALMYKERDLVLRSLRDYFTSDVNEILIDNPSVLREVKNYIHIIAPKQIKIAKKYNGAKPIFSKYALEDQISSIFESRVELKSGGSIVIEQTEAMVSIDVNSGKSTSQDSIEGTAHQTNLEAAEEIARQLRLRDLGGLIVIDFIDMWERKHKTEVEKALKLHLKRDKAKTKVGRISVFGMLEMSRQRLRPPIVFGSYSACPYCRGKGLTPSAEKLGLNFYRELNLKALKADITMVRGIVPPQVANFLLNERRKDLLELENQRHVRISIEADNTLMPWDSKIIIE